MKDQKQLDESSTSVKETDSVGRTMDGTEDDDVFASNIETSQSFGANNSNLPLLNESDCEKHFQDHGTSFLIFIYPFFIVFWLSLSPCFRLGR